MLDNRRPAITALLVGALVAGTGTANQDADGIIVSFRRGIERPSVTAGSAPAPTGLTALDSLNRRYGCSDMRAALRGKPADPALASELGLDRAYLLRFGDGISIDSLLEAYRRLGCFDYVEPNSRVRALSSTAVYPNDYYFSWLWGLDNREKYASGFGDRWDPKPDADIDAPEAWEITLGDSSVVVAILDSGCKTDHPELAGRFWRNADEIPGNGMDDDNNGFVDDTLGYDVWYDDNHPEDSLGHGTGVTGVLAANQNNSVGHAGVDWRCKVMVVKVIGNLDGGTNITVLVDGIRYAADNGADIINMSLGDERDNRFLRRAVEYAAGLGVVMVAAVGNDNAENILYPAAYPSVIAVGSSDPDDRRSDHFGPDTSSAGSNYGAELDVVAPGNNIFLLSHVDDTLFTGGSGGTSLASPHVAGIASLLLANDSTLTPDSIKAIIRASADDLVGDSTEDVAGWDKYMGYGRVSAYQALTYGQATTARTADRGRPGPGLRLVAGRLIVEGTDPENVSASLVSLSGRTLRLHPYRRMSTDAVSFGMPVSLSPGLYVARVRTERGRWDVRIAVPGAGTVSSGLDG
ncbi:MAG: S8 family serine peptidase [Chitinivibrionales bacterium]|nr:S8 family serine peptidase [Chitinivibrionales bacterium]